MIESRDTVELRDGGRVIVREVRPEDAPALRRLVGRLSVDSVRLRYFGPMKELSEKQARRFAEVDGCDRFALVAIDPRDGDEIVAVVRYDRHGSTRSAEYAALVEDRFQGKGLGARLTHLLVEAARERGVGRLEALILPENRKMLGLLHGLGLPETRRREDDVEKVEITL